MPEVLGFANTGSWKGVGLHPVFVWFTSFHTLCAFRSRCALILLASEGCPSDTMQTCSCLGSCNGQPAQIRIDSSHARSTISFAFVSRYELPRTIISNALMRPLSRP
jgi:hypothetical protein